MIKEQYKSSTQFYNKFKIITESISNNFNDHGLSTSPYRLSALDTFNELSDTQKQQSIIDGEKYLNTQSYAKSMGWTAKDDMHFLWSSFKKLGIKPASDFFNYISKNDAIEIYNLDGIQTWRNLSFMEICNYTIEEMFCYPWEQRYTRNKKASEEAQKTIEKLFMQSTPKTIQCNIHNILTETLSLEKYIIDTLHKAVSIITDENGTPVGFAVSSKVKVIGAVDSRPHNKRPTLTIV